MLSYNGYNVIKLKTSEKSYHNVYVKEHRQTPKDPQKPDGKTMIMLNVPPYVDRTALAKCFEFPPNAILFAEHKNKSIAGQLSMEQQEQFQQHYKFKIAFIIFKSTKLLHKALHSKMFKLYTKNEEINEVTSNITSGIEKWTKEYFEKIPNSVELEQEIEKYMHVFDGVQQQTLIDKKKQREQNNGNGDDDDGWITVGKGKRAGFQQSEIALNKLNKKIETGRKNKEHVNFYAFQIRESKQKKIVSLRRKFEADRRKIDIMKKMKRLKPL